MDEEQKPKPTQTPTSPPSLSDTSGGNSTEPAANPTPPDPAAATDNRLIQSVEAAIGAEIGPEEKRTRIATRIARSLVAEFYRGPLPHPRHLKAFEEVCPGAGNRILAMAEKAQARQEDRLDKAMDYEYGDRRLGLFLGFFALVALLVAGLISLALKDIAVGSGLMAAGIIGTVIGTFVHGRRSQEEPSPQSPPTAARPSIPAPETPSLAAPGRLSLWRRMLSIFGIK